MSDNIISSPSASTPAQLPAIPRTGIPEVDRALDAVREHLEVRQGARGNPWERVVTLRDLQGLGLIQARRALFASSPTSDLVTIGTAPGTLMVRRPDGTYASASFDVFAQALRQTRLWKDLQKQITDPTRFDDMPEKVRALLAADLLDEAKTRGADIQRLEQKFQNATESFAAARTEITAAIGALAAGVRRTEYAFADQNRATAGSVTTVQARLDGFGGGTASVEDVMSAIASRTTGLEAQRTLKVNAGGAVAAIGMAATSSTAGVSDSYLIFVANNFAFVKPTDVIGTGPGQVDPTNPGASRIPFGIDSDGVIYLNGNVRINAAGMTLNDLSAATGIYISFTSEFWKVDQNGTAVNTSIVLTANFTAGLTGTVTWSKTGAGTAPPAAGTSNTWTIYAADQTDDTATYTASFTSGGITYTDDVTIVRLRDGSAALTGMLTNESHTVPASTAGVVSSFAGALGSFKVFKGVTHVTGSCTFSVLTNTDGLTASIDAAGAYAVTAAGTWANASTTTTVTLRAAIGGVNVDKVFTLTKALGGATGSPGINAKALVLLASSQVFQVPKSGAATPASITFTLNQQNLGGAPSFSVTAGTATLAGTGASRTLAYSDLGSDSAMIQVSQDGLTDTVTVVKVREGIDALAGFLTNESHTVPASSTGTVSSFTGAGGTFKVFLGTTDVTVSCAFSVQANPDGVTTSIGAATGVYSVTAAGSLPDATRVTTVTYRATYAGLTLDKVFTLTKAMTGAKGDPGNTGVNGTRTAILDVYQWAAAAPTSFPSGTSTYTWATGQFTAPATLNGWSLTPPAPVLGQTLYIARTVYADTGTTATTDIAWSATSAKPLTASGSNGGPGPSGSNGTRTAVLEVYQWAATTPGTFPAGTSVYTWATGQFTAPTTPNGWSLTPGAAVSGQTLWGCEVMYVDTGTSSTSTVTWSTSTAYPIGYAGTNGTPGTPGTNGQRGTVNVAAATSGTTWSDSEANAALAAAGYGSPQSRDIVTLYNNSASPKYSESRFYSSGTWQALTAYINGNLLVSGTVAADMFDGKGINIGWKSTLGIYAFAVDGLGNAYMTQAYAGNLTLNNGNTGATSAFAALRATSVGSVAAIEATAGSGSSIKGNGKITTTTVFEQTDTTQVSYVNALKLQGYQPTDFALVGHNHSGVYAPVSHTHSALYAGGYSAQLQSSDGNFVVYNGGSALWSWMYGAVSDRRLKDQITPTARVGVATINAIQIRDFKYGANAPAILQDGLIHTGVIAQEVVQVIPQAVGTIGETMTVNMVTFVPFLIKAVQELSARVALLENRGAPGAPCAPA